MADEQTQPWMPQSHEQGWMQKVAELTEQVQHLRQENERLRQTIERHRIYENELKAKHES